MERMTLINKFKKVTSMIDRGSKGLNEGLPHGIASLVPYIPNIQKHTYYLIGAESSVGKTALADSMFVFNPIDYIFSPLNKHKIKLKIFYWTLEIDAIQKMIKIISRNLYLKYNILADVNYLLSRGDNLISKDVQNLVNNEDEYFEKIEKMITFIDSKDTSILKTIESYYENVLVSQEDRDNTYVIGIIDHIGLATSNSGKKTLIDDISRDLVYLRNRYDFIPVVISQFNRSLSSTDRAKLEMVEPRHSDFKDTGNLFEDSNICIALFDPVRYGILNYLNYDIKILNNYFRSLHVLKNRDGESNLKTGLLFLGACGYFKSLTPYNKIDYKGFEKFIKEIKVYKGKEN